MRTPRKTWVVFSIDGLGSRVTRKKFAAGLSYELPREVSSSRTMRSYGLLDAMLSRIHSRKPYTPFSPRYFRLDCRRSPHLTVQWSTYAGLAISLSIILERFAWLGSGSARKLRTSAGVGIWPVRSSDTRRR